MLLERLLGPLHYGVANSYLAEPDVSLWEEIPVVGLLICMVKDGLAHLSVIESRVK